jgi:hypothetical protein
LQKFGIFPEKKKLNKNENKHFVKPKLGKDFSYSKALQIQGVDDQKSVNYFLQHTREHQNNVVDEFC